ncbi:MAG: class II fumarate hydratase [Myxococcota bacterium]|jgi:fumarate hydratase class II|nr:class II fumarate hydratase [Myxococcota bacterium]
MTQWRTESDSLGELQVPSEVYYGAQTQRAVNNFPISSRRLPRPFIRAIGLIKESAAQFNLKRGALPEDLAQAIIQAAEEVVEGKLDAQFVVDVFQTGSGTSTNMNANEVIANRAIELLGGEKGSKHPVHPNDHVNLGQSSNDVIPTAIHIAAMESIDGQLLPALQELHAALEEKARAFDHVLKIGRTHLQDAVPVRLGQEFAGYASQLAHGIARVQGCRTHLRELALGGTAVGTGLNAPKGFAAFVRQRLQTRTGIDFVAAPSFFEALGARDAAVECSGQLKTVATSLMKIANDIRWLASGPRCGLGEITLPSQQPGSSIMPGKVNPVLAESMMMVCAQIIGNDAAITIGNSHGNLELNVMMPMIASNLLESMDILANAAQTFARLCVVGITANEAHARGLIEQSLAMVTALVPVIGYDAAAKIAQRSVSSGRTVRELVREAGLLDEQTLEQILDPRRQTEGPSE